MGLHRLRSGLTLLLLLLAHVSASAAIVRLPGDTDRDGDVDISDLITMYNNYTGPGYFGKTASHGDTDGDVMAELDHNIGRLVDELEAQGITDDTVVVFASDNGPWLNFGNHGGSSGPLREGKRTIFDGVMRTPCIVYWPGQVPVQAVDTPVAIMDFYATFAGWAGAELPDDRKLDAVDLSPLLLRDTDAAEYDAERAIAFYAYYTRELHALRRGKWKLVLPHRYQTVNQVGNDGVAGSYKWVTTPLSLFDMHADPGETTNLAEQHPDIVESMREDAQDIRQDLGDSGQGIPPSDAVRQMGFAGGI